MVSDCWSRKSQSLPVVLQIISTAETSDVPQELVCLIGIPFTASSALIRDWDMSGTVCDLAGFVMTTLGM